MLQNKRFLMPIKLIQSLFLLFICTSINGSQNAEQQAIVNSLLYKDYDIQQTPKNTRPKFQPLADNLKLPRSTIWANKIEGLYKNNQTEQAVISYAKIAPCIPDDLSMLNPKTRKSYELIHDVLKKIAYKGDINAQIAFTEKNVQRLSPFFNDPAFSTKMKDKHCAYAFEQLDFTINLTNNNIPITTTDSIKKDLIELRNNADPATALIIATILYLQATNDTQKNTRLTILQDHHCPENPEIEAACQFLINYGNNTLSAEDATKKFIQTIMSQKGISRLLSELAHTPICSHVITKLEATSLEKNDPRASDLHYVLAELHYKCKNYHKARTFYDKNKVSYLKEKKITNNVFQAYIAASESFCKDDINYLTSLVGTIENHVKKLEKTDLTISYGVGLLTQTLIKHHPTMNVEEKIALLLNGLDHLAYAKHTTELNKTFHRTLSALYEDKNDSVASLKHLCNALKYTSPHNNCTHHEILHILTQAETTNPELYAKLAPLTKMIVEFITNQHNDINKQKNHTLVSQFASSDLCAQLLPYCEQAYKTNKQSNNTLLCVMALAHKNNGNYVKACNYIEKLSPPIPSTALLLKASIYVATEKELPPTELETILKQFISNKKPSHDDQETIVSLLTPCNDFFIQTENYALALKLIIKLTELQNHTPPALLQLTFYITKALTAMDNAYINQWLKELEASSFYDKIQDPSYYDSDTNIAAGVLLIKKKSLPNYEKIISHFTTALASDNLLPHTIHVTRIACGSLYCDWAATMHHDTEAVLRLLDQAMQYDDNNSAPYEKACFILRSSNNKDLINHALELLEEDVQKNRPTKELSQLELAHAYLNYSSDATRLPIIQQCIPLNIDKAITYLKEHNNKKELLDCLANIFSGTSSYIDEHLREKYINLEESLTYITILINTNSNNIDYIAHRMYIYIQMDNPAKVIENIDLMLNAQDLSNASGITREKLLEFKIQFLLNNTPDDSAYNQALECFEQLRSYKKNSLVTFDDSPNIQERTRYLITNKNFTNNAIDWCCLAAEAHIGADFLDSSPNPNKTTLEQKELAHYLLLAAKLGNFNAQITLLPYLGAVNYFGVDDINYLAESLNYAREALFSPHNAAQQNKITMIIQLLHQFTEEGIALAYYVLCDYYKKDTQQLEKTMLLFSKAQKQHHYLNNKNDIVEKITISCRDTLLDYVKPYMNQPKKRTVIQALATFTLGSMYQYSNKEDLLNAGTLYLDIVLGPLCTTFKLAHYKQPIQTFLASRYYKDALAHEKATGIIDIENLQKSAQLGLMSAAHALAKIYIEQHKNGKTDISVNVDDFLPILTQDVTANNPPHPTSLALYPECCAIIKNKKSQNKNSLQKKAAALEKKLISLDERMTLLEKRTSEKNMIKYIKYTESSADCNTALRYKSQGKLKDAIKFWKKAADKENHQNAYIALALADLEKQDYSSSEKFLHKALTYGLIKPADSNTPAQFHNMYFVYTLFSYLKSLTTTPPFPMKPNLLSTIKETLVNSGINISDFCEIFKEVHDTNLSLVFEPKPIKRANIETIVSYVQNSTILSSVHNFKGNMIKDHKHTETSPDFLDGLSAAENNDKEQFFICMHQAAAKNHPWASLILSSQHFLQYNESTPSDIAETLLQKAFLYGLIDNQFCYREFFSSLCTYIDTIITIQNKPSHIKERLLSIIKNNLITHHINLTCFYEIVHDVTKINLPLHPAWIGTKIETPLHAKPSIVDLKKSMVKDLKNSNISPDFHAALKATIQGDIAKSIILMDYAATQQHDPCACVAAAAQLLEAGVQKNALISKKFLYNALAYGLIEQQFCNSLFLVKLCKYIQIVISIPNETSLKRSLLLEIKKHLLAHKIDLTHFCEIVHNETTIDLYFCPEWSAEEEKKPTKGTCSILKKPLLKDTEYKETYEPFLLAQQAYSKGEIAKGNELVKIAAEKFNHSISCICHSFNALSEPFKTDKNYTVSEKFLQRALELGIKNNQLCNIDLLTFLCQYIIVLITEDHPREIKQHLLSIIRRTFESKGLNMEDFYKAFQAATLAHNKSINLSLCPEWSTEEEKKTEPTTVSDQKNCSLIQYPNHQETADFDAIDNALMKNDIPKALDLAKKFIAKENHPVVYMFLSGEYLKGKYLQKNNQLSENFLKKALSCGLVPQQFCTCNVLSALLTYMSTIITAPCSQPIKQKLLTIIREALEANSIDLAIFCTMFQDATTLDLTLLPGWKK